MYELSAMHRVLQLDPHNDSQWALRLHISSESTELWYGGDIEGSHRDGLAMMT